MGVEVRQVQQAVDGRHVVADDDEPARPHEAAALPESLVVHLRAATLLRRQDGDGGASRDDPLELDAFHQPTQIAFQELHQVVAHLELVDAGARHGPRARPELRSPRLLGAVLCVGVGAVLDDPWNGGQRLRVVDQRR